MQAGKPRQAGTGDMAATVTERLKAWTTGQALPVWSTRGVDLACGGYVEAFDLTGAPLDPGFKRVRAMARQMYVFSHATHLGWMDGEAPARHGFEYLTQNAWLGDGAGWARRLTTAGEVLDATPDLYDAAFCLFALSWYYRAFGDNGARDYMRRTAALIPEVFAHPGGEGFLHWRGATCWRQQNPHMHLLEASLAAMEADPDGPYEGLARTVLSLFERRLFDPVTGTLGEFFTDDWARAPGDAGRHVEPGHQFEWAWILTEARRIVGVDLDAFARALIAFSERHGVDASGATVDGVRDDGAPHQTGSRTWPNTERIKAGVARAALDGAADRAMIDASGRLLLERYFANAPAGCWIDQFDAEGRPTATTIPASTLYHVFLAVAEADRVA